MELRGQSGCDDAPQDMSRHAPQACVIAHRPHSSSFLGLCYRILNMNPAKELLRGLWVFFAQVFDCCVCVCARATCVSWVVGWVGG